VGSLLSVAACYCSHDPTAPALDGGSDAGVAFDAGDPVIVSGCEDPALWEATAPAVMGAAEIGGGPCSRAQFPAHEAWLTYYGGGSEHLTSCWRVVAAHPESRWSVGEITGNRVSLVGFERPVTFEGRLLTDEGVVRFVVSPFEVALEARRTRPLDEPVVAVIDENMWVTAGAIHALESSAPAEGTFVDGAVGQFTIAVTLERTAAGHVLRGWSHSDVPTLVPHGRLLLPPATSARLVPGSLFVVLDDRVQQFSFADDAFLTERELDLPSDAVAIVAHDDRLVVQTSGELLVFPRGAPAAIPVGEGFLLGARGHAGVYPTAYYLQGTRLDALDTEGDPRLDPIAVVDASDLAVLGRALAFADEVLIGTDGFVLVDGARGPSGPLEGPRSIGVAELFGDGASIVAVGSRPAGYAVRRADGSTELVNAPYVEYCD
jgi:hypothetical protein